MTTAISSRQMELIEAAGRILTASGVGGLTIKNLAHEMGFSEAAIYRHYASKEDIVVGMLNFLAEDMDRRLSAVAGQEGDAESRLQAMFTSQFDFFGKHPHFVVAVFSDGLLEEKGKVNAAILRIMSVKMRHLMPIIMEGQQQGLFTNAITTEQLVHMVMGAFRLQMFKWRLAHFGFDNTRSGAELLHALLTLIKKEKS